MLLFYFALWETCRAGISRLTTEDQNVAIRLQSSYYGVSLHSDCGGGFWSFPYV